jgi:hypothetical protein
LVLPPFYAPVYAQVAKDVDSLALGIVFGIVTALGLTALFETLEVLEDPFTAFLALDGIDVREEFEVLHFAQLVNTRKLAFPNAPAYPLGRLTALRQGCGVPPLNLLPRHHHTHINRHNLDPEIGVINQAKSPSSAFCDVTPIPITTTTPDYESGVDDDDDNNDGMDRLDLPEMHRSVEFGTPISNENESAVRETIYVPLNVTTPMHTRMERLVSSRMLSRRGQNLMQHQQHHPLHSRRNGLHWTYEL